MSRSGERERGEREGERGNPDVLVARYYRRGLTRPRGGLSEDESKVDCTRGRMREDTDDFPGARCLLFLPPPSPNALPRPPHPPSLASFSRRLFLLPLHPYSHEHILYLGQHNRYTLSALHLSFVLRQLPPPSRRRSSNDSSTRFISSREFQYRATKNIARDCAHREW